MPVDVADHAPDRSSPPSEQPRERDRLLEPDGRIGRRDAADPVDRHGVADGEFIVGAGEERRPLSLRP